MVIQYITKIKKAVNISIIFYKSLNVSFYKTCNLNDSKGHLMQSLPESFVDQIRELKTLLLPSFLSSSIIKIVIYFLLSNNFTHMADEAHRPWSDLT